MKIVQILDQRLQAAKNGEATLEWILSKEKIRYGFLVGCTRLPESVRHRQLVEVGEQCDRIAV
jgi:hypothetical protein